MYVIYKKIHNKMSLFKDLSSDIISYICSNYILRPYLSKGVLLVCNNSKIYKNMKLFNEFSSCLRSGNKVSLKTNQNRYPFRNLLKPNETTYNSITIIKSFSRKVYDDEYLCHYIRFLSQYGARIGIDLNNGKFIYRDLHTNWQYILQLNISYYIDEYCDDEDEITLFQYTMHQV